MQKMRGAVMAGPLLSQATRSLASWSGSVTATNFHSCRLAAEGAMRSHSISWAIFSGSTGVSLYLRMLMRLAMTSENSMLSCSFFGKNRECVRKGTCV